MSGTSCMILVLLKLQEEVGELANPLPYENIERRQPSINQKEGTHQEPDHAHSLIDLPVNHQEATVLDTALGHVSNAKPLSIKIAASPLAFLQDFIKPI